MRGDVNVATPVNYKDIADLAVDKRELAVQAALQGWGGGANASMGLSKGEASLVQAIAAKIEALNKHASQLGDWNPGDMMRQWAAESGKKVGFNFAESFFRITLKSPADPTEPLPEV